MGWAGYGADIWGVSACDGPADIVHRYRGERRTFRTYAGRGIGGASTYDDGTLAPTAAASSLPFAPEIVIPAIAAMRQRHGAEIYGRYGFVDAFNPSFDFDDSPPAVGRRVPGQGWFDVDHLGIDQGPIVAMLANHRDDLVWRTTRGSDWLRRGLSRAGFSGGWLAT
jgi:hypothetical protein